MQALNLVDLIEHCKLTLCWNFESIVNSEEWLNMDIDFIEDLVSSSNLVINSIRLLILYNYLIIYICLDYISSSNFCNHFSALYIIPIGLYHYIEYKYILYIYILTIIILINNIIYNNKLIYLNI